MAESKEPPPTSAETALPQKTEELVADHSEVVLERVFGLVDEKGGPPPSSKARESKAGSNARSFVGLRSASLLGIKGRYAEVLFLGQKDSTSVALADHVEPAFVQEACEERQLGLIECQPEGAFLVGVVQTRRPEHIKLTAPRVSIEASEELTLTSGRAALQLHFDGSLELLGTRISATSRGLLKLVGRALRLN